MANFRKLQEYVNAQTEYPFPNEVGTDPKLKLQKDYYLQMGHAMVASYVNGLCFLPYSFGKNKRTFKELHEYATGCYPNNKIKDSLIGAHKKKNGKYITKMNISWDTLPVISKMYDVVREKNMRQDYDVDVMCIDDDSIMAREADRAMLKYLVDTDTKDMLTRTKFKPNTKFDPNILGLENEQDVDLYFECGAYILDREIATIAACNKTKLVSNYKHIQDKTFDDLIKYGIAVWKNEIDKVTGEVKMRHVPVYNPELDRCPVIIPYSESDNFEDNSAFGEIRTITVATLRKEHPELNAQQIIYLAQCYTYLNPQYTSLISTAVNMNGTMQSLDNINRCKILILDYQWLGCDVENYIKNEGRTLYKAVPFDYVQDNSSKRKGDKHIQKKAIKKFACSWVIGTDILLEYGPAEDIIYYGPDGDKCPGLDYFITKTGNISLVERSIAIQDDIDLANVKLRSALSSAIPSPRMVIQTGLLDNVFLNNIKQQPEDNMATFRELGYLMVNAVDDDGKPIFTNQKLVDFLPMGIQEDINVFTGQILAGINNLREVWGIAQGADGSTPQKYDGARKTELAAASSNAALFPTFNCFEYLFVSGFTDVVKKWQISAKDRKITLNYAPLGSKNMKALALDSAFTNSDLNIALTLGSTQQELQQLMQDIAQMKAVGIQTNFQQGITTSEYLYLTEKIKSGNIREAMWVMAKIEKKKIAAAQAIAMKNQEQNATDQQNSAAQTEINKQQTEQIKGRQDRMTMVLDGALKMKTQVSAAMINTYDAEKDPSPVALYQQMIDDANSEIIGIMKQDSPQQAQGGQPGQEPQADPGQMPPEQQQVA